MAQTLLDLAKWCDALPDRIEKAASDLAVTVAFTMAEYLIRVTPVDVTTAVSNWQVSLNKKPMFWLPAIVPGSKGSTAPASRREALAHVRRFLDMKDPGDIIYLSNLTPYIIELNKGSSKQAPAGWVESGVLLGERYGAQVTFRY